MNSTKSTLAVTDAFLEILRFWAALVEQAGYRKLLTASVLNLLSGLSEGLALLCLIPLLQALDASSGQPQGLRMRGFAQFIGVQPNLAVVLAVFLALAVVRSLLNRQSAIYLTTLKLNFLRDVEVRLYSAIAHANWLFLRRKRPADLLAALTSDIDRLDSAVYYALQMPGRALTIAAHVAAAWMIAPSFTVCALGTGVLFAWLVRSRLVESLHLGETLSDAYRNYYHMVSQFLAGLKITKSFVAEDRYVAAFAKSVSELRENILLFTRNQANARLLQELAGAGAVTLLLGVGAGILLMPTADVLVLALILYRLLPLVQGLQGDAQELLHAAPAAQATFELLATCMAAREGSDGATLQCLELRDELRLEHVGFKHSESDVPTLRNVSFRLPAGTLTVLYGPSGAGKSTLLDLLAGLASPDEGRIWIDGRELTDRSAKSWRASVAYVLQEAFLFHDTIRENLRVANPNASEEALIQAVGAVGAATFVEALPQGMDTIVGDRGARLSGGERQRLAIARALLKNPSLLILDEPTNSLDPQSEQVVLGSIEALRGKVTMILVTHSPERVKAPDQMLRMEAGTLEAIRCKAFSRPASQASAPFVNVDS
ncbi:Heterocyst differentiation ATP-binding protein HepA [freshwater sediment metagenome]|uniref:Heterocyst differentiation ATP-binding protein HepA n=1 Tax=freshwater sediment metagenome TaxID=556182 RepID=A0AA48M692_9ZZZZ